MIATANHTAKPRHWPGRDYRGSRVPAQRERGQQGQQVQRAGPVPAAQPVHRGPHAASRNVICVTHLVLCTPGAAGMIVRAG